jgi:hypothetical protein
LMHFCSSLIWKDLRLRSLALPHDWRAAIAHGRVRDARDRQVLTK